MPRRFLSTCDIHAVALLNACGWRRRWRWPSWCLAWLGTLEGSLLCWGVLSLIDHALAFPLLLSGVLGLLIFKAGKYRWRRSRPFMAHPHVVAHAAPPDLFSFPSGHAMHAGSMATIVFLAWPAAWPLALAWVVAMGTSRIVLGLHYPTDVVVGALVGSGIGLVSWQLALAYPW